MTNGTGLWQLDCGWVLFSWRDRLWVVCSGLKGLWDGIMMEMDNVVGQPRGLGSKEETRWKRSCHCGKDVFLNGEL